MMENILKMMLSTWYFWAGLVVFALFHLFYPIIKGKAGETVVAALLKGLPESQYRAFHDILLETERGKTQIDHIVVSHSGVFVIETKTFKGWIFGSEGDKYWTQQNYRSKKRFYNPLRQNFAHVKAVEALLAFIPGVRIIPIVAFSNECDLKLNVQKAQVIYFTQLKKTVLSYTEQILDDAAMQQVCDKIRAANILDRAQRRSHINSVKEKKAQAKKPRGAF